MRVIGGEFRSRRLKSIPGVATRPTPDRLRETLFDICTTAVPGCVFLDAYAGTGAVGIEALSRGAKHAYFLEKNRAALEAIRQNLASLGLQSRATVVPGAVLKNLAGLVEGQAGKPTLLADIVFLDPPYALEAEYTAALDLLSAAPPPLIVVQQSIRLAMPGATRIVRQGDNALSFFAATAD
jgi:16S rRNA (guanine(966)-N(2))-methyltransferase RsmD